MKPTQNNTFKNKNTIQYNNTEYSIERERKNKQNPNIFLVFIVSTIFFN